MDSEAKISLEWANRLGGAAGKKASPVVSSVHITLSSSALPAITSSSPDFADGMSIFESDGLRRSQSTSTTRPPPCAMSAASEAAMVDLPSFGREEVTPMTLVDFPACSKSTATLIARIASAKRESGESTTIHWTLASRTIVRRRRGASPPRTWE